MVADIGCGVHQSGQTQCCQTGWQGEKKHYYELKEYIGGESDMKDQLSLGRRPVRAARGKELVWAEGGRRS